MITLETVFWSMVIFFALMGLLRGWTKEVIATAGLVLSLFALSLAASTNLITLLVADPSNYGILGQPSVLEAYNRSIDPLFLPDPLVAGQIAALKREFFILSLIHLGIVFFSYQGPTLAGAALRDRLRVRDSVQDKLLGGLIGAINGYLIFGTLWTFLEYRVTLPAITRLDAGFQYVFYPTISRPADALAMPLLEQLPLPLLGPFLPFLVVGMFLFVIIVMI